MRLLVQASPLKAYDLHEEARRRNPEEVRHFGGLGFRVYLGFMYALTLIPFGYKILSRKAKNPTLILNPE